MASFAASLLDELMGRNRNLNPTEKDSQQTSWSDPDVCKFFLAGFCPHDLFTNTRADLGYCNKLHDDELQKAYKKSSRYLKMGYEQEFIDYLFDLVSAIDKRIKRGHARLAQNQLFAAGGGGGGPLNPQQEKQAVLSQRITELVDQAERLGCEGKVEEAQGVLKLCDQLKEERTQIQEALVSAQQLMKEMEVCEICGAFLVVGDAPQRVQEHLEGKQHLGYARCREAIDDLKKKLRGEDPEREARLKAEREQREREKLKEREREREREREKEKRREKEDEERHRASEARRGKEGGRGGREEGRGGREGGRGGRERESGSDKRSRSRERRHRSKSSDNHRSKLPSDSKSKFESKTKSESHTKSESKTRSGSHTKSESKARSGSKSRTGSKRSRSRSHGRHDSRKHCGDDRKSSMSKGEKSSRSDSSKGPGGDPDRHNGHRSRGAEPASTNEVQAERGVKSGDSN